MLIKINYSSYYERQRFSNVVKCLAILKKNEFCLVILKKNTDEIVSSFLLECLSVCKKFSISVGFFLLIK